ncbi:MAG: hypothetical protein J5930_04255 [Treponema sp.]|nr:hypothetical protein [Treponema sp.]
MNIDLRELARRFQNYAEEIESLISDTAISKEEENLEVLHSLVLELPTTATKLLQDYLQKQDLFVDKARKNPYAAFSLVFLLRFYSNILLNASNLFPSGKDDEILCSLLDGNKNVYYGILDILNAHTLPSDTPNNPQ